MPIKRTKLNPPFEGYKEEHPAYALVQFHRVSGNAFLFGSEIHHQHTIRLTIGPGAVSRGLKYDRYHSTAGLPYIEVEMSANQFAEAITTMNSGEGVPCTLLRKDAEKVERLTEPKHTVEQLHEEVDEHVTSTKQNAASLRKLLQDMEIGEVKLTKANLREALHLANRLETSMGSSLDYIRDTQHEHIESLVAKAKVEVEAFTAHTLQAKGVEAVNSLLLNTGKG